MNRTATTASVAITLASALILTACGSSDGASAAADKKQTLSVWAMGTEGEKLGDVAKEYQKANPNITIKVTPIGWDVAHQKLVAAAAAGKLPDVMQMGGSYMGEFADMGVLEPVDTATFNKSDFFPAGWEQGTVDAKTYGVPWYVDTRVLFYRTDLAEQADITKAPATVKELQQAAEAYQQKAGAKWGLSIQPGGLDTVQSFYQFLYSAAWRDRHPGRQGSRQQPRGRQGAGELRQLLRQGPEREVGPSGLRRHQGLQQRQGRDVLRRPLDDGAAQRELPGHQGQVGRRERAHRPVLGLHGRMAPAWRSPQTASTRPPRRSSSRT